jgi:hypothetical protein
MQKIKKFYYVLLIFILVFQASGCLRINETVIQNNTTCNCPIVEKPICNSPNILITDTDFIQECNISCTVFDCLICDCPVVDIPVCNPNETLSTKNYVIEECNLTCYYPICTKN